MPLYNYCCSICEGMTKGVRSIDKRHDSPMCECGGTTKMVIVPTMVAPLMPEYKCPVTGEYVVSTHRRNEIMKENNLVEAG